MPSRRVLTAQLPGGRSVRTTPVSVGGSVFQYNSLNTVSNGGFAIQGSVFSTAGQSLSLVNSTLTKNTPAGMRSFNYPGATVTITNTTVDQRKFTGTTTLSG